MNIRRRRNRFLIRKYFFHFSFTNFFFSSPKTHNKLFPPNKQTEIKNNKAHAEQQAKELESKLAQRSKMLSSQAQEAKKLEAKIAGKTSQLLRGGAAIKIACRQNEALSSMHIELKEQEKQQEILENFIEEAAEAEDYMHRQYASRQEEMQVFIFFSKIKCKKKKFLLHLLFWRGRGELGKEEEIIIIIIKKKSSKPKSCATCGQSTNKASRNLLSFRFIFFFWTGIKTMYQFC